MKTLVFHGYGQSAAIAKEKWDPSFKKLGILATYLEGPLDVVNRKGEAAKGWFTWESSEEIYKAKKYDHVSDTLIFIDDFIRSNGPFDNIIGYSQGGTILSIYLDRYPIMLDNIKRVVIISSYRPLDPQWYRINSKLDCKTMLVMGELDEIVPMKYTKDIFHSVDETYIHNGAHIIPTNKVFIDILRSFMKE